MENIGIALQLMAVGMITVFIILIIVIQLGNLLTWLVNKFAPEDTTSKKGASNPSTNKIDSQTMTIIQAAVMKITNGKGSVKKVERI